jgi:hypothetical protein
LKTFRLGRRLDFYLAQMLDRDALRQTAVSTARAIFHQLVVLSSTLGASRARYSAEPVLPPAEGFVHQDCHIKNRNPFLDST